MKNTGVELALNNDAIRTRNFNEHLHYTGPQQERNYRLSNDLYTTSRIMVVMHGYVAVRPYNPRD